MDMNDLQKKATNMLLQIQKMKPELFDYYINEPMDETTLNNMNNELNQITSDLDSITYLYSSSSSYSSPYFSSPYLTTNYNYGGVIESIIENLPEELTKDNVVEKMMKSVEEAIEKYIYNTFDKYYIKECNSYIYSILTEKIYEIISDIIINQDEYITIVNQDELIDIVFNEVDLNYFYDMIDDILNQPITMEEKMADVGMSYKDFL